MKFELSIDIGNDAMQSPADTARALTALARRLSGITGAWMPEEDGLIRDDNGNTVGSWAIR